MTVNAIVVGQTFQISISGTDTANLDINGSTIEVRDSTNAIVDTAAEAAITAITITGTLGQTESVSFNSAFTFANLASLTASASSIVLNGNAVTANDISFTADQIALNGAVTAAGGANPAITLAPQTGIEVTLGDSGTPAGLIIDNTELANLTAPTLNIGNATAGQIDIGTATVSSATLNLVTGAGIVSSGGTLSVGGGAGTLNVTAAGTVDLFSGTIDIGAVGGSTTSGDFKVQEGAASTDLTANAITTSGGQIVVQDTGGNVDVNDALSSGGGNITLASTEAIGLGANLDAGTGTVDLSAGASGVSQTGGTVTAGTLRSTSDVTGSVALTQANNSVAAIGNFAVTSGNFTLVDSGYTGTLTVSGTLSATNVTLTATDLSITGGITASGLVTLNASGTTTLDGALTSLGSLTTDAGGSTVVDGAVTTTGAQTYHDAVTLGAAAALTSTVNGAITFDSTVDNGGFNLTFSTGGTAAFGGAISGSGNLIQDGSGTTTFAAVSGYTGTTNINGGTLLVDGSIASSSLTTVASGATLGGHGAVGSVTVASGGTLSPGDSPGILTTGDVTLSSGSTFKEEIGGTSAGNFDQLVVLGTVDLGGATLNASFVNGFTDAAAAGANFKIIDNDGTGDPVTGTFAGLAEGALLTIGGGTYQISYHGGDGNDVVLTALNDPPAVNALSNVTFTEKGPAVAISPNLTVADVDSATLIGATVHITNGLSGDVLAATTTGTTINAVYDPATETLTLSGTDTLADYQAVLGSVTFSSSSDNPTSFGGNPARTVEWQLNDGASANNLSTVATSAIDITAVNDAPVAHDGAASGNENTTITGSLSANDVDGPSLTYLDVTAPAHGSVAVHTNGTFSYTPAADYSGTDSFTFKANDGSLDSNVATESLRVDQAPTGLTLSNASIPEDSPNGTVVGTFTAQDPDSTAFTYSLLDNANGLFAVNGSNLVVADGARLNFAVASSDTITAQVADESGLTFDQTFTIGVTNAHLEPGNSNNTDIWQLSNGSWASSITPGSHPGGAQVVGVGDFNGDGTSDVLWQNPSTGDVDDWIMANGSWAASNDLGSHPGTGWQIGGVGDFNGDGTSDVLWFNPASGQTDIWELVNGKWSASVTPGTHPAGYQIAGTGDFNHDGTSDVLFYNPNTGDLDEWKIVNGQWAGSVDLGTHPGSGWQVGGVGDFNGDGTSDVLWTNPASGQTDIWELQNGKWAASVSPGTHPAGYQVVGVGDFNHDGTSDILWQNSTTGDVDEWKIANGHWAGSVDLGIHPFANTGWQVAGIGDFNHDGTSDVLWHNSLP